MKIKGYACHWHRANGNKEIVVPTSFDKTMEEVKNGRVIPVNFNHDDNIVLGSIKNFYRDSKGLYVVADLNEDVMYVKDYVQPLIVDGTLDRFSTQGMIPKSAIYRNSDGTYLAKEFELTAVAIVTNPADKEAVFSTNCLHHRFGYDAEHYVAQQRKRNKFLYIL